MHEEETKGTTLCVDPALLNICDDESVVKNSTNVGSDTNNKKHSWVACHFSHVKLVFVLQSLFEGTK